MRNAIACVSCRMAKRQCLTHDDKPPCERCKAFGRAESCRFPEPGTSSLHRQSKSVRAAARLAARHSSALAAGASLSPLPFRTPTAHSGDADGDGDGDGDDSAAAAAVTDLGQVNPFGLFSDEVKNSYLRCSYKWSFHHIPTLLQKVRDESLDLGVMWAILALSIRFVNEPPAPYETSTEASNAYAAHARQLLQPSLESPSLARLQALLMITGHSWGAGDGARAWMYLGTAVRMVQVLGLCDEDPTVPTHARTRQDFIHAEERRRAAWTCFLMDSLLSGGKGRKRSLGAEDMRIQLPCEKDSFTFGEAVNCERLDGRLLPDRHLPTGPLGIVAHSMRAADFWGDVARWSCSSVMREELPWAQDSQYQRLIRRIEAWKGSLPPRLQYSLFSLHAHSATDSGQAYIYMWAIYYMAKMFLHRAYLPVLGLNHDQDLSQSTLRQATQGTPDEWRYWRKHSRRELFETAATVCDMMEEMRSFGVFFLRGLVPWIGFTIYTAVGIMLYCFNFASPEDDEDVVARAKDRVMNGCNFLQEMKAWPMAGTWFETIKRMQAFYRNLKSKGDEGVTPDERENLKNALVDYGHLQSPPAESSPSANTQSSSATLPSHSPPASSLNARVKQGQSPLPGPQTPQFLSGGGGCGDGASFPSPPGPPLDVQAQAQAQAYPSQAYPSQAFIAPPETAWDAANPFEFNYDWDYADFNAIMADATVAAHGFWANFPGETGFT